MTVAATAPQREPSGIRELLDHNPIAGERRAGPRRFWTGREEKVLREHYPSGGVSACLSALPGRSASSIYQRASALGLRVADAQRHLAARQRWESSDQIDMLIRRTYQKTPAKRDILNCAAVCGRPRWWVSKRALKLGLVAPRFKTPEWTTDEEELLHENAYRTPAALQRILARKGFVRTETAILVKLRRLGADRTDPDHLNGNQLAQVMGVDRKTISSWIAKGWLKATRREATATDDYWWIHRRDVARFIVENVAAVDIRKVEKFWFIDLLVNCGGPVRASSKREQIIAIAAARPDLDRNQIAAMVDTTASSVSVTLSTARRKPGQKEVAPPSSPHSQQGRGHD